MKKTVNLHQDDMTSCNWQYDNPVKIVFGENALNKLPGLSGAKKTLLVTTPGFTKRGVTKRICQLLGKDNVFVFDGVQPNPSFDEIGSFGAELDKLSVECIVALGGGSVIDTAKALSVVLSCRVDKLSLRDLLAGKIDLKDKTILPIIAVPTTAGTGSEVTPFATIWDKEEKKKYSLEKPQIYPRIAILDPVLTLSLPKKETITAGLDALAHAFEAIWNRNATPITDVYAINALEIIFTALPDTVGDMRNITNRSRMMRASLFSGLAMSQTRTALSHSISYPLTVHFGVPHGLACAFTIVSVFHLNRAYEDGRFQKVAGFLKLRDVDVLEELLVNFMELLRVRERVRAYLPSIKELMQLSSEMITSDRVKNNLAPVSKKEILEILRKSLS
ncbi:MAG: phosphonoacetaldehyde reductase [Candidatus Omnitrophica bacterium]|nr:phosphonoacetaldehyde reductase [Candidatus Omnitrophota bacterium]MBU1127556.1 phosphonoacetaldehyde reductase [Candidatus Omnitrophota bacterium]MBU1785315.1 phosphonoacetaldehyde reductase [Candidatus Omnitrophota bacterium]MBU1852392.1 phosphonoacetaldehyde reductase [Candidatus Omnitrophota bacterium]